jgi:hypothetical protein
VLTEFRLANAALLFSATRAPGATNYISEVGVMAASVDQEKLTQAGQHSYIAVLTVPTGIGRNWSIAAKGESCDSIIAALRSLFEVTAAALEKYQGNVFKSPGNPSEVAGGIIDEALMKQPKENSWASVFG